MRLDHLLSREFVFSLFPGFVWFCCGAWPGVGMECRMAGWRAVGLWGSRCGCLVAWGDGLPVWVGCSFGWVVCELYSGREYLFGLVCKSIRWMPWYQEPKKDVVACDMPRGVGKRAVIRGCPNGETWPELCLVTCT